MSTLPNNVLDSRIEYLNSLDPVTRINLNERTTQAIAVLPILQALGWDDSGLDEVKFEYSVDSGRVDIALFLGNRPEIFIETKPPAPNALSRRDFTTKKTPEEKLLGYCQDRNVHLGVLTNGFEWKFYSSADFTGRVPHPTVISLIGSDPKEVRTRLELYLSKTSVDGKTAHDRLDTDQINSILSRSWNKLLYGGNKFLIRALRAEAKKLLGERSTVKDTKIFLQNQADPHMGDSVPEVCDPEIAPENKPRDQVRSRQRPCPRECPKNIKAFGRDISVTSWRNLMQTFLFEAYKKKRVKFRAMVERRPKKFAVSEKEPSEKKLKVPLRLGNSDIWVSGYGNRKAHWGVCESVRIGLDFPEDALLWFE